MIESSKIALCNRALGFMGVGRSVNSLDEATAEANTLKRYYDVALASLLQRNDWNFCRGVVDLALITEKVSGFLYIYQYPNTCAKVLRLLVADGLARAWSGDFRIGMTAGGSRVICADVSAVSAQYTVLVTDPSLFPPLFEEAFCWNLARMACWGVSDVSTAMRDEITKQFLVAFGDACVADANEGRTKFKFGPCDYIDVR